MDTPDWPDLDFNFDSESTDQKVKRLQNESEKLVKDKKIYRKYLSKQHNKVSRIDELLGKLPKKNEQIRIITQQAFNAYAILLYIVEKHNIDECYLTTYNMDKNTIRALKDLVDSNNIKKLTILISDSITYRMPDRLEELKKIACDKIKVILAWNHTKIILAKTKNDNFVIEGSGNISDNARIEQYLFENCKDTYIFHSDWIDQIKIGEYKRQEIFE